MKSNNVKCYSVRLLSLEEISAKCLKAIAFDGSSALIPKSLVMGKDYDVKKSDAYWIQSWFLHKSECNLQFSAGKEAWFNKDTGEQLPTYKIEVNIPKKINPVEDNSIQELKK